MDRLETFIHKATFAKNAWLRWNAQTRRLFLYGKPRPKAARMTYYVINTRYDLPFCIDAYSFVALVMKIAKIGTLWVDDDGFSFSYNKKDLYRAKRHFTHTDTMDILEKLVKRACERDKATYCFPTVEDALDRAERLAESIREEIYHLFRYFSDEELKSAARSLLGANNRYNNDTVKVLQLIKRIKNYNDGIGDAVEIIENYNKSFEETHKGYMTVNGFGHNSFSLSSDYTPVTYKSVLNFIEAARKGSEQRAKCLQTN